MQSYFDYLESQALGRKESLGPGTPKPLSERDPHRLQIGDELVQITDDYEEMNKRIVLAGERLVESPHLGRFSFRDRPISNVEMMAAVRATEQSLREQTIHFLANVYKLLEQKGYSYGDRTTSDESGQGHEGRTEHAARIAAARRDLAAEQGQDF